MGEIRYGCLSFVELESGNFECCRIVKLIVDPNRRKFLASMLQPGSKGRREKDGLWAVLAWLSILAHVNKDQNRNVFEKVAKAAPGGRPPPLCTSRTPLCWRRALRAGCPRTDGVYDGTAMLCWGRYRVDRHLCCRLLIVVIRHTLYECTTSHPACRGVVTPIVNIPRAASADRIGSSPHAGYHKR